MKSVIHNGRWRLPARQRASTSAGRPYVRLIAGSPSWALPDLDHPDSTIARHPGLPLPVPPNSKTPDRPRPLQPFFADLLRQYRRDPAGTGAAPTGRLIGIGDA
jgi:hypothetical protein